MDNPPTYDTNTICDCFDVTGSITTVHKLQLKVNTPTPFNNDLLNVLVFGVR